jgi:hypothetical protein
LEKECRVDVAHQRLASFLISVKDLVLASANCKMMRSTDYFMCCDFLRAVLPWRRQQVSLLVFLLVLSCLYQVMSTDKIVGVQKKVEEVKGVLHESIGSHGQQLLAL